MARHSSSNEARRPLEEMYSDPAQLTVIFQRFIVVIVLGLVAGVLITLTTKSITNMKLTGLSIIPVLAAWFFVRRGMFELAATFLALVLITAITLTAMNGLGIHHLSVLGYPAILIIASLVVRGTTMGLILLYNLACVAWLVFGELAGIYTPGVLTQSVVGDFFTVGLILIITAIMVRQVTEAMVANSVRLRSELRERKLAESKYRAIFENAIDGIFQSTPDGRFIAVNPALARMYGYTSPEEMLHHVTDIAAQLYAEPGQRDQLRERLMRGEIVTNFESLDHRKDGSMFWTAMNVQAILDETGTLQYFEGTVEDITTRKQAEAALRESEERYRTLFDGILDGVYRSTPAGRFVDVNNAMVKMFGYSSRAEMLAVDIKADLFFNPDDRRSDYLAPGEERVDIFLMKHRDGSEIWVEDHGHYLHDEQGNILFHDGILRDVTARVIAEAERQRAEEHLQQFKTIMDESNDAVFIIDPLTSRYQYFNRRACLLLGYAPSELTQLQVLDVAMHITSLDVWGERVRQVRENNGLIFETKYRRKDGSIFPVEVSARLLASAEGEAVVAFARDISERRRAEQEREHLIGELEAKNSELERFAYTVSHDLKAPLVTIRGFLGYLEKDIQGGKAEHVSHDVLRINGAVDKMQALLNDLLELSRIGRLMNEPETVPFNDLVTDALEAVHGRLAARGITVQTQPNLPQVLGDRRRLTEVLQNLIDNAAKFMGDQPAPHILIGQRGMDAESGHPVFFVQDNGMGIASEHHERVFGLFNKLNVNTEGTGIGLALVRRIVEFHGGRIWVESEPGQGATFCFSLPVAGRGAA